MKRVPARQEAVSPKLWNREPKKEGHRVVCSRRYSLPQRGNRPSDCFLLSYLHLTTKLDDPVRRNAEKFCRGKRVTMHRLEELATDHAEPRFPLRHDRDSAQEERRRHHIEIEALCAAARECPRNIRILHE